MMLWLLTTQVQLAWNFSFFFFPPSYLSLSLLFKKKIVSANKITPKDMCTLSPIPFSSLKLAPSPSGGMGALRVGCGDVQTRMGGRFQFKQFKRITIEVSEMDGLG